jgi:hypothetical protein
VHRDKRLSFFELRWVSRIASTGDALRDWNESRITRVRPEMPNALVRRIVVEEEVNAYALGTETLNFLDNRIRRLRPNAVLELGSGVSTVVLAACMAETHGGGSAHVFSVDESETYLDRTLRMLDAACLRSCVRLAHRRVRDQVVCGRSTRCYELGETFLQTFLEQAPEVVLIDGPSGGGTVRLATLPLVLGHVRRPCTFFLDDALRDDEIAVATLWQTLPGIRLHAVHLVGHGVLEGIVEN